MTADATTLHQPGPDAEWWRTAVIYQIYPRSFADADGDGMGDLAGITARLPHLAALGVDAVWLSPFYRSPQHDGGYDVADYRDVDPIFGTLDDADALVSVAHDLGLRVVIDLVPNHTSDEHAWFRAALAAGPGSRERARYVFREGGGERGEEPPNNWQSIFGGPAWTRVTSRDDTAGSPCADDGQWYLHLFDSTQPDLNWDNPEVRAELESVLRFWLDRGVDGFRVDVAHGLVKAPGLPDWSGHVSMVEGTSDAVGRGDDGGADGEGGSGRGSGDVGSGGSGSGGSGDGGSRRGPMFDQEGVHEIYRRWREIIDSYDGDRVLVAEAWVDPMSRLARYVRPDEMHQAFNFAFLVTPWDAGALRRCIAESYAAYDAVGAPTTWVLSNHDVVRHASRLGKPDTGKGPNGIGAEDPQPDAELGLRRARAASTLMLALPGSAYLYQGEELGLPEHTELDDSVRQDPAWWRTGHAEKGRDGCRVPLPWAADEPAFGFSATGRSWLPQPAGWAPYAADAQDGVPGSTLELYRAALRLRAELGLGGSTLREAGVAAEGVGVSAEGVGGWAADASGWADDAGTLAFVSSAPGRADLLVVATVGGADVALPEGYDVVLASGPLTERAGRTVIPGDTTVWARPAA